MSAPDLTTAGFDFDRLSPDLIDRVRNSIMSGRQKPSGIDLLDGRVAENYREGYIGLEIGLTADWQGEKNEFTCFLIPSLLRQDHRGRVTRIAGGNIDVSCLASGGPKQSLGGMGRDSQSDTVLVRPRDSTEEFENVIAAGVSVPSRIGLYQSESVVKFWGDLLATPCLAAGETVFKVIWAVAEGEVSASAFLPCEEQCGSISGLVKNISKVGDNVICPAPKVEWERLKPLYLQLAIQGLRVNLGGKSVGGAQVLVELGLELRYFRTRKFDEVIHALEALGVG